jgi:hypothetical protein
MKSSRTRSHSIDASLAWTVFALAPLAKLDPTP